MKRRRLNPPLRGSWVGKNPPGRRVYDDYADYLRHVEQQDGFRPPESPIQTTIDLVTGLFNTLFTSPHPDLRREIQNALTRSKKRPPARKKSRR